MTTCDIPDAVVAAFKKHKLSRKENWAYVMKISLEKLTVEEDFLEENITNFTEFVQERLPDSTPRFVAYSGKYVHPQGPQQGRITYPLLFIYYCPPTSVTQNSLYASTKSRLVNKLDIVKIVDLRDKDDVNEQWLNDALK